MQRDSLQIPLRFRNKLKRDKNAVKAVEDAVTQFELLVTDERPFFFPEYTDHGRSHLNSVCELADWLITDAALKNISARDIEWLVYSTLLHDAAMHLQPSHFYAIRDGSIAFSTAPFQEQTWSELWIAFEHEAKHWSSIQRVGIFGEDQEIPGIPMPGDKWEAASRKYVGEFLRRHHPSIAYGIAVDGLPLPKTIYKSELGLEDYIHILGQERWEFTGRELIGFIALSHGFPLRVCYDYLAKQNRHASWNDVHPTLLMALLRLADYFHLKDRANAAEMPELKSPISRREWRLNQGVFSLTPVTDQQAVYIDAEPTTITDYLRLKFLLEDIQAEIDSCWAVLGECYFSLGQTFHQLATNALTKRRIKSSIETRKRSLVIGEKFGYYPKYIGLSVSTNMLPLLTSPIYGDNPAFAGRELIANALDAVRLRVAWESRNQSLPSHLFYKQDSDVRIDLDGDDELGWTLSCTDTGIGMTIETIEEYFLTAGHSFRQSKDGRLLSSATGENNVVGRFGVGALAYFILGREIVVTTRHVTCDKGWRFTLSLETGPLRIESVEVPIGTQIMIKCTNDQWVSLDRLPASKLRSLFSLTIRSLRFDSFEFSSPPWAQSEDLSSHYFCNGERLEMKSPLTQPVKSVDSSLQWLRLDEESSYFAKVLYGGGYITVNGILIREMMNTFWPNSSICISDPHGTFPLTLQRTDLTRGQTALRSFVVSSLSRDFSIAWSTCKTFSEFVNKFPNWSQSPVFSLALQLKDSMVAPISMSSRKFHVLISGMCDSTVEQLLVGSRQGTGQRPAGSLHFSQEAEIIQSIPAEITLDSLYTGPCFYVVSGQHYMRSSSTFSNRTMAYSRDGELHVFGFIQDSSTDPGLGRTKEWVQYNAELILRHMETIGKSALLIRSIDEKQMLEDISTLAEEWKSHGCTPLPL